jgi:hypothetical protein
MKSWVHHWVQVWAGGPYGSHVMHVSRVVDLMSSQMPPSLCEVAGTNKAERPASFVEHLLGANVRPIGIGYW